MDVAGFETAMETARNLSRDARVAVDVTAGDLLAGVADELGEPTRFTGYGSLAESDVRVRAIVKQGARVDEASPGTPSTSSWTRRRSTPRAAARSATRARSSWREARRSP